MILAAQYFRPPFPDRRRWHEDLRAMKAAGLNTAYLWACWGWIEPEPGKYEFDDYDLLVEEAAAAGLDVVINIIAEIQPFWVPRELPDAQMIDHMGRVVVSSPRVECTVGLTPGGCTDHPGMREAMGGFLRALGEQYAGAGNLAAWDLWNETRWAVQADGWVCYCPSTLKEFRAWLERRYGDLDGLNEAWRRKYCSWDDVFPGKLPGRIWTDLMEFSAFLTWRSREHMAFRHSIIRGADPDHLIVAHAMNSASTRMRVEYEQELSRGNDWDYLEFLDGFGSSLFPLWFRDSALDLGARIEAARSPNKGKLYWVGELQGGSARMGLEVQESVPGRLQQRWLWNAVGRGAKAVNFWCWRDEVFSRESSGFGITGADGHAADRLDELAHTGEILRDHTDLVDAYEPAPARVGVVYEPSAYQLDWAQYGTPSTQATRSMWGYLVALEKAQIPYDVVESRHYGDLSAYRVLVMPWPLIVDPRLAVEVAAWVRAGGTLIVESEADAYDALGFYRYPEERPFASGLGIRSLGRRVIGSPSVTCSVDGFTGELPLANWAEPVEPEGGEVLASSGHGALVVRRDVGAGRVISIGSFVGLAHAVITSSNLGSPSTPIVPDGTPSDLPAFVRHVVATAGGLSELTCDLPDGEILQWRYGTAGAHRVLFVVNEGPSATVTFTGAPLESAGGGEVTDLATGVAWPVAASQFTAEIGEGRYAIFRWSPE